MKHDPEALEGMLSIFFGITIGLIILFAITMSGCSSPNEPEVVWTMESVFEIAPADTSEADDVIVTHFCWPNMPGGCWMCYNGNGGARDHDGDGFAEDNLRDHPQEGVSMPPNPSGTSPLADWTGWTLGTRVRD